MNTVLSWPTGRILWGYDCYNVNRGNPKKSIRMHYKLTRYRVLENDGKSLLVRDGVGEGICDTRYSIGDKTNVIYPTINAAIRGEIINQKSFRFHNPQYKEEHTKAIKWLERKLRKKDY